MAVLFFKGVFLMDTVTPDISTACGHWLDVLCYTFRSVSDPVKIIFILAFCAVLIFALYAFMNSVSYISRIFRVRPHTSGTSPKMTVSHKTGWQAQAGSLTTSPCGAWDTQNPSGQRQGRS